MKAKYKYCISAILVIVLAFFSIGSALAAVVTNQGDYPPGSVVTVSGNNSDGAGYAAGETVHVAASAPDSSSITCDATADANGSWSCGLALAANAPAGNYSYTASGLTSNVSQNGTFTVSAPATPSAPWIQSDQADYAPASTVTLTSGGWQPGETVQLVVNDDIGQTWNITATIVADSTGAFTYPFVLPNTFVATYSVTATGTANDVAKGSFTDALNSISPTSGPEGQSFVLTVNRSGTPVWTTSTKIVFAGTTLATTFVNSSQLTATVPASLMDDEGTKAVTIVTPAGGPINFTVTEGDAFTLTPATLSASTNTAFSGTVATLADTYDNLATGTFTATINWGDNSGTSAGTVTRTGPGAYTISGSHTYTGQFLSTSVRTAVTLPAATIPVNNATSAAFPTSGTLVIFTSNGYQTVTYTGKTTGTSASFTGVTGGSGTAPVGSPITQPFSAVGVTVSEATPGTATASTVSPLTVTDGTTYAVGASSFSTTEGATYGTSSSSFFPSSIQTSVFPSVGNYRLLVDNGSSSAWFTLYTSGPNNYMYPNTAAVFGSVVFGDEGSVPYTETLYLNNGTIVASGSGTVTVNDAGPFSYFSTINTYHPAEGASTGSIQIGKFIDPFAGDHTADFTATVHWGDGSSDTAQVVYAGPSGSSSTYTISGSHTYAEEGTYSATYDVVDDGGTSLTGISTATIVVSDPAVVLTAAAPIIGTYGTPIDSQALATFTDPGGAEANDGTHYAATIDWGGSFGSSDGTISFSAGTFTVSGSAPYTGAGSYSPTVTVTHEAAAPQSVTASVVLNPAPLTITASSASVTYGDAAPAITASYSGFIGTDNESNSLSALPTCSTTYTQGSGVSGSPYKTSCSGAVSTNYAPVYVDGSVTVDQKALTITAKDASKTFGATLTFAGTEFTTSGLINSDTVDSVTLTSDGAAAAAVVGTYDIVPSAAVGTGLDNYAISYKNGTLMVGQAVLTITAKDASKTYGDTLTFAGTEFTTSGLLNSDKVASVTLTSDGAAAAAGVGTYDIVPSDAVGSGLGNYVMNYAKGTLTVGQASLTITAKDASKTFGDTLTFAGTEFTTSGLLNSDTVASVTLSSAGALDTAVVGTYDIVPSAAVGSGLGNYTIGYVNGSLKVNQATVTITASSASVTYGDAVPTITPSYSGFVGSDSITTPPTCSTTYAQGSGVGGSPYPTSCSGAAVPANYAIAYVNGSVSVSKAPLTITASSASVAYGNPVPTITPSFSGFLGSDNASNSLSTPPTCSTTYTVGSGVSGSPYPSSCKGAVSANYAPNYVNGSVTVSAKTLTITASSATVAYGDAVPAITASYSGFIGTDNPTNSLSTQPTCSTTYAVGSSVSGSPYASSCSGAVSSSYTILYVNGSVTVNKASLTVTADNKTHQYSDPLPALTYQITGFKNNEGPSVVSGSASCSTTGTQSVQAGSYPITCNISSLSALNYKITFAAGNMLVTQEDAATQYSGDTIASVGTNLNLRATVWDSAASGFPGTPTGPVPDTTLGDITKMWIAFDIYPASSCFSGTPTTKYAHVTDTGTVGDGIGTATTTYTSSAEASYCVVSRLVASATGGANPWYAAPDAQSAAIDFYTNSGKFTTGGGWINDPSGSIGIFGFVARYDKAGKPLGQIIYVYRGKYNGVTADFIIKSSSLTALQIAGTAYPLTSTLQGKASIAVYRAKDGVLLYSDGNATFTATAVDSNKNSGIGSDSLALMVYDKSGVLFKNVPTALLAGGNVVTHLK